MRWRGALVAALVAIGLADCVPVPADHVLGYEVDPDAEKSIKIGVTTREEVITQLGEPTAISEKYHVLAYGWYRVNWDALWLIGGGSTPIHSYDSHEMLLIQIDETDHVNRVERVEVPAAESDGQFLSEWASEKTDNKP
jgi:hypothetical protein